MKNNRTEELHCKRIGIFVLDFDKFQLEIRDNTSRERCSFERIFYLILFGTLRIC